MSNFHLVISPTIQYTAKSDCYFHYKNLEIVGEDLILASNESKTIQAIFYGDLFNAKELKTEIKKLGFHFQEESLSEIVALGFDAWKEKFFSKINGCFSLLIFDEENESCYAVRDHLGHKPLYWAAYGQYLFVSTHLKPILGTGVIPQTPALDSMSAYLYFGFVPQDFSIIEKINKLLPGHYLKIELNRKWQIIPYWSLSHFYAKKSSFSEEEYVDQLGNFLEKSLRSLLGKEVALLSGSSLGDQSLYYLASHLLPKEKLTLLNIEFEKTLSFPIDFSKKNLSITSKEIFAKLPSMVWELEEPLAKTECVHRYFQSQLAKQYGFSSFLSSAGFEQILLGDQNFVNEEEHFESWIHKISTSPNLRKFMLILSSLYPPLKYEILRNSDIDERLIYYLDSLALFKGKNRKKASPNLFPYFIPELFLQRFHQLSNIRGLFKPLLYFDCKTALPDTFFFEQEKLFSFNKSSTLYPFTQKDFVEFFVQVPDSFKFKDQIPGYLLNKLLERSSQRIIEESSSSHLFYQKMHQDPLCKHIFSLLQNSRLIDEGYLSLSWLKNALNYPHMVLYTFRELWALLILEIWFRLFISHPLKTVNPHLSTEELLSKIH